MITSGSMNSKSQNTNSIIRHRTSTMYRSLNYLKDSINSGHLTQSMHEVQSSVLVQITNPTLENLVCLKILHKFQFLKIILVYSLKTKRTLI
jgi:hypothetical protein